MCKVLVVDDDPAILETIASLLREFGHDAVCAENAAGALQYLQSTDVLPQVILLDLMMPTMDGGAFLEELRGDRALSSIPVVVITASTRRKVPGANLVVAKPLTERRLVDVVSLFA